MPHIITYLLYNIKSTKLTGHIISRAGGLCLCGFHAGGEEFDEFGAVGEEGVKSRRGVDKFAVAQELKPVFGLSRFLERDLEFRREVRLALRVSAFGDVRANGSAGSQHLLSDDRLLPLA